MYHLVEENAEKEPAAKSGVNRVRRKQKRDVEKRKRKRKEDSLI
jgi:hypothetical protein